MWEIIEGIFGLAASILYAVPYILGSLVSCILDVLPSVAGCVCTVISYIASALPSILGGIFSIASILFSVISSVLASFWAPILGAATAIFGFIYALPIIGFGAGGVIAHTLASFIHSIIGNVAGGSLFALLQSIGVVGLGNSALAALASVGAFFGWLLLGQ